MFEKNVQSFAVKNPKASALLSFATCGTLHVVHDAEGAPILCDKTAQGDFYYHCQQSAKKEAQSWRASLELEGIEYVAVFGIGMGHAYEALSQWLQQDTKRQLIFLEDDLRVLLLFLESKEASLLLNDPQVHIFYIEDSLDGLQVLQSLSWSAYGKNMLMTCLPFYEAKRKKTFDDVKARIQYETSDIHLVLDEYMGYGVSFFRNFWKNLFLLPGSYKGNKLQGAFRNIPAIVVAAGPSLSKHLEALGALRDKALIFSGGSSVNALVEAGIQPHFGAGIDPNPLQYLRFRQALAFQVPFFYRSRLLRESAELIQGPRLYLKGGDGYNISDLFEKKLKIPGSIIGGGHSVANFIIEIAQTLGCSPIILVGYDLAFGKDLERYAPGVEHVEHSQSTAETNDDLPVAWQDASGHKIHTAWKWILEADWIADFAKAHPRAKIINATEGGLGIKNIPHMSLKEVEQKYLATAYDLDSIVHTAIQDAGMIGGDYATILTSCSELYDSLERAKQHLDALSIATQKASFTAFQVDPHVILLQAELKAELAYQYILEVFDRMRAKLEYYRLQFALHPSKEPHEHEALEMKLLSERYTFLKDTVVVNQLLIAQSVAFEKSRGRDVSAFAPKSQVLWS